MVTDEKMKQAREWVKNRTMGFLHKDLVGTTELSDGHKKTADRLLKQLLQENPVEKAYRLVEGRVEEFYRPFQITEQDVLQMRALRDPHAAQRLGSFALQSPPVHPETLREKRRALATPWHPAHKGAKYVHSAMDCPSEGGRNTRGGDVKA